MKGIPGFITPQLADGVCPVQMSGATVSTRRKQRSREPVDFLTRFCGVCVPMLFERIDWVSPPGKTTLIPIASGPAERHDNRTGVRVAKPSSRPVTGVPCRRGSVSARAGPVG